MIKLPRTFRSDWASVSWTQDNSILVGLTGPPQPLCLLFPGPRPLQQVLQSRRLRVNRWIADVPRRLCLLRRLDLPAANFDEALPMIEFELPALLPLPAQQLLWAAWPLAQKDSLVSILLCILKRDTLQKYLQPLREIGIQPRRIVLSSLALCHWLATTPDNSLQHPSIIAVPFSHDAEVLAWHNQTLCHSEFLPQASNNGSFLPLVQREILQQQQLITLAAGQSPRLFLAGPPDQAFSLQPSLNPAFNFENLSVRPVPLLVDFGADTPQPRPAAALAVNTILAAGLAQIAEQNRFLAFNLFAPDDLRRRRRRLARRHTFALLALAFSLIFLLWLCLHCLNWRADRLCRAAEAQISPIAHAAEQVKTRRLQLKALRAQLAGRDQILRLFDELSRLTPPQFSLSDVQLSSRPAGNLVQLNGQADTLARAFAYTEALQPARLLNNLRIENAQQVARPGGAVVEFKASAQLPQDQYDEIP